MTISPLTTETNYSWQSTGHFGQIARKPIDIIVLHHNASTTPGNAPAAWVDREASAHYQVEPNRIVSCLDEDITAWSCGAVGYDNNSHTIAIEHLNSSMAPSWSVAPATQERSAQLVAEICKRRGIPIDRNHIKGHDEMPGTSTACPGGLDLDWITNRAKQIAGGAAVSPSKPAPKPAPAAPISSVNVHYGLHALGGGWLGEITNFNNSNGNGFAGNPSHSHDMLYIRVDSGSLRYRVHTLKHGWLGWVSKGDKNDTVNGCAGILGDTIDAVQIYYTTPGGQTSKQAYYRTQTAKRSGWLGTCCDDGTSIKGFDGWAGIMGEPLDRLQVSISSRNPF